jgi:hypothetical protein
VRQVAREHEQPGGEMTWSGKRSALAGGEMTWSDERLTKDARETRLSDAMSSWTGC